MNPLQSVKPSGLNQAMSNGVGFGADPSKNFHSASTTKRRDEVLDGEEDVLDPLPDLDAAVADVRHRGDEGDTGRRDQGTFSASEPSPMSDHR